jgi:hypothetical protein
MATTTLDFTKKKETKGCIVYEEAERPGQPIVVGSLYVKRFAAGKAEKVKIILEVPE